MMEVRDERFCARLVASRHFCTWMGYLAAPLLQGYRRSARVCCKYTLGKRQSNLATRWEQLIKAVLFCVMSQNKTCIRRIKAKKAGDRRG